MLNKRDDSIIDSLRESVRGLGDPQVVAEVDALDKRLGRYANLPGVIKGLGKLDVSRAVSDAALGVIRGFGEPGALQDQVDRGLFTTWAVISLAARSDPAVIDEVETALTGGYVADRIRELRRVTEKAIVRAGGPAAATVPPDAPDVPQSIGKVKAWLAAADRDPSVLAPRPRQKSAAKAAAVRALGQIGTPAAFEVLTGYATMDPTGPLLDELLRAWAHFDRREYAAAMFQPILGYLDLGVVTDIEGIDAVQGLESLRLVVDDKKNDQTDLSPLALCSELDTLQVQFNGPGLPSHLDWLRPLTGLRSLDIGVVLRSADLSPLVDSHLERLKIWVDGRDGSELLDMPHLRELTVFAESRAEGLEEVPVHPGLTEVVLTLVRRGVPTTVYDFDKPWVSEVRSAAEVAGLQLVPAPNASTITL